MHILLYHWFQWSLCIYLLYFLNAVNVGPQECNAVRGWFVRLSERLVLSCLGISFRLLSFVTQHCRLSIFEKNVNPLSSQIGRCHCIVWYRIVLHCIVLYCIALY